MNTRRAALAAAIAVSLTATVAMQVSRSAAEDAAARSALTFSHTSVLWMEGKSTIHDWESRTNTVSVTFTRDQAVKDPADVLGIESLVRTSGVRGVDVTIPVLSLKSGKDGLDKNLRKAMKADQYANVGFHLAKYTVTGTAGDTLAIRAEGALTVTGKEKPVVLQARAWRGKEGMWLEGQTPLRMSEFGIHPPTMMLGTLRVDDRIVIHYRLLLTTNDADAMGTRIERTH